MPQPEFSRLARALLAAGVAPCCVSRTIHELRDHCADIEADALAAGYGPEEAAALARAALGDDADIVAAMSARVELLRWSRRWPRSAQCIESVGQLALLPAAPIAYCAAHGTDIARWSVSASLAAFLTAALLFSLQWIMSFGPAAF